MLIFGFGHRTVKDFGTVGKDHCKHCNNNVDMHKLRVTTWFTLFFIPLIPYRTIYLIACPICNNAVQVSKEEFNSTNVTEHDIYAGKTETQINYLKQMDELRRLKNDTN